MAAQCGAVAWDTRPEDELALLDSRGFCIELIKGGPRHINERNRTNVICRLALMRGECQCNLGQ